MKPNSFIIALLIVMVSISIKGNETMILINLKSIVHENPSLQGNVIPSFSWQMQSEQRNQVQTAYQVMVSESHDLLKTSKGIVWDSGKLNSAKIKISTIMRKKKLYIATHKDYA